MNFHLKEPEGPCVTLTSRADSASTAPAYENIILEKKEGGVALIKLNRPKALNALSDELFKEL